jgi:hypothetical protein
MQAGGMCHPSHYDKEAELQRGRMAEVWLKVNHCAGFHLKITAMQ